jgi:hypothetical protein
MVRVLGAATSVVRRGVEGAKARDGGTSGVVDGACWVSEESAMGGSMACGRSRYGCVCEQGRGREVEKEESGRGSCARSGAREEARGETQCARDSESHSRRRPTLQNGSKVSDEVG